MDAVNRIVDRNSIIDLLGKQVQGTCMIGGTSIPSETLFLASKFLDLKDGTFSRYFICFLFFTFLYIFFANVRSCFVFVKLLDFFFIVRAVDCLCQKWEIMRIC